MLRRSLPRIHTVKADGFFRVDDFNRHVGRGTAPPGTNFNEVGTVWKASHHFRIEPHAGKPGLTYVLIKMFHFLPYGQRNGENLKPELPVAAPARPLPAPQSGLIGCRSGFTAEVVRRAAF
jgi:hypothetical protein